MYKKIITILIFAIAIIAVLVLILVNGKYNKVFSIKNKDFYLYENNVYDSDEEYRGVKLLEYDNTKNNCAYIYYVFYDYTTDPSYYYTIKIQDEKNNNLLLDGEEEQVIGGIVDKVKIKKTPLTSKITISMYEKCENEITQEGQVQIDLDQDLVDIEKIDQSNNIKEGIIGDVKFDYIDTEYVYFGTLQHAYSEKFVGQECSIPVKIQYGNRLASTDHIDFSCEKNVNNLTLEEAFKNMKLITQNFGQYGLSDVYGLMIPNTEETIIVTFDDMINLCKGKKIIKDGKEYSKNSFDSFAEISFKKEADVEIGKDIKAIKYGYESDISYEYYMFIYKDNIYYLTIPTELRIKTEVYQFLNSLELVN